MKLDLPFPDATLAYDCAACGYQCCSGLDTELYGAEIESLLALRPELRPLTARTAADWGAGASATLATFGPRCFLLGERGDCRLESEVGREAKPWVCRLYPFNDVSRIGSTYVFNVHVIGNAVVCPFTISPGHPRAVRHANIEREIRALRPEHPVWATARSCTGLDADEAALFDEEKRLRERLEKAHPFETTLAIASDGGPARSRELVAELRERFDLPRVDPGPREAQLVAALAPSIRLRYFCEFHRLGYRSARDLVGTYFTLGWLYVQAIAKWQGRTPTADLALKTFDKLGPRLQLGALFDSPVRLEADPELEAVFRRTGVQAEAFCEALRASPARPLWCSLAQAIGRPTAQPKTLVPYLGALDPLSRHLIAPASEPC